MVSRELIKAEIDDVGDEYLNALFKIIKAFRRPLNTDKNDWHDFSEYSIDRENHITQKSSAS